MYMTFHCEGIVVGSFLIAASRLIIRSMNSLVTLKEAVNSDIVSNFFISILVSISPPERKD